MLRIFEKYVVTVGLFAFGLCSRSVSAKSYEIVFPCEVVGAFRIEPSEGKTLVCVHSIGWMQRVYGQLSCLHRRLKYKQSVIGDL